MLGGVAFSPYSDTVIALHEIKYLDFESCALKGRMVSDQATIMDKSVDTFEQNNHFLLSFFRNFKKLFFCQ